MQAGYRSLVAFWLGGAGANASVTVTHRLRLRVGSAHRLNIAVG